MPSDFDDGAVYQRLMYCSYFRELYSVRKSIFYVLVFPASVLFAFSFASVNTCGSCSLHMDYTGLLQPITCVAVLGRANLFSFLLFCDICTSYEQIFKLENGTRRAQIPRKPLIFPSPNKQKILSTQRFELSNIAFLAQFSYRLSYRAVLIWLLLSDYYYQMTIIRLTKILSTQRFELSNIAFLEQCSYRLSYRAVLICLLLSD